MPRWRLLIRLYVEQKCFFTNQLFWQTLDFLVWHLLQRSPLFFDEKKDWKNLFQVTPGQHLNSSSGLPIWCRCGLEYISWWEDQAIAAVWQYRWRKTNDWLSKWAKNLAERVVWPSLALAINCIRMLRVFGFLFPSSFYTYNYRHHLCKLRAFKGFYLSGWILRSLVCTHKRLTPAVSKASIRLS